MKKPLTLAALAAATLLDSGCATRTTATGGKETNLLGGAVVMASESFQPVTPATVNTNTTTLVGKNGPSGRKISLLWGLLTFNDY